jgi:CDGSH-type Zn-finger protein
MYSIIVLNLKIMAKKIKIKQSIIISQNGPYLVSGNVPLQKEIVVCDKEGYPVKWKKGEKIPTGESYSLCRCGKSKNPPFCDGEHHREKFVGTLTASNKPYLEQSTKVSGPKLELTDASSFCIGAGFCDKGLSTWGYTQDSGNSKSKKIAIQQACNCPAGRLVAWEKGKSSVEDRAIEKKFKPSISIIVDESSGASGPLWVKGGIQIENQNGAKYEKRNRVTLCRCGKSNNKPFCDGTHVEIGFIAKEKKKI